MHALVLTVLALHSAGGPGYGPEYYGDAPAMVEGGYAGDCAACEAGHGHGKGQRGGYCGPMPQSCYFPSYGCYPSTRFMNRYPAFHGYYYRKAYNYRHYFDYPWHATPHEPTSHFSYNTPADATAPGMPIPGVPTPAPDTTGHSSGHSVRTASALAPVVSPGKVGR